MTPNVKSKFLPIEKEKSSGISASFSLIKTTGTEKKGE